ncbi:MAG: hypothetical protein WDM76_02240 [Limisphaerales bacterium]
MKSIRSVFGGLFIFGGLVTLFSLLHAQETETTTTTEVIPLTSAELAQLPLLSDKDLGDVLAALAAIPTISKEDLPENASTFHSLAHPEWAPLPASFDWPIWNLDGFYLLNDLDRSSQSSLKRSGGMNTMFSIDPNDPGDGDGGTNIYPLITYPPPDYGTNLWLLITNVTTNVANLILSNTLADVQYEIQGKENLSATQWVSKGFVLGSELTNWTPANVIATNYPMLFLRARSWVDSDGSGMPDWWQLEYFGTTGVDPYGDPDGDGWSNIQEYQNGTNPTVFNTPATPQLTVSFNILNSMATLSWVSASTSITNYQVVKYDYQTGEETTFNFSPNTNIFLDDLSGDIPDDIANDGPTLYVTYQIQAQYANGNSALSEPQWLTSGYPAVFLVPGAQGSAYLAASALPQGTVGLRLTRVDYYAQAFQGNSSFNTNYIIPISAMTNGLYLLPTAWTTPTADSYGYAYYTWWVETINVQGRPVAPPTLLSQGRHIGGNNALIWMVPPYFDGRAQLKQNLVFLLRAANSAVVPRASDVRPRSIQKSHRVRAR